MLPLGDDLERGHGRSYATLALSVLLLLLFAYTDLLLPAERRSEMVQSFGLVPARLLEDPVAWWPSLLSYIFLHGSWLHVLGNVLFLWVFGRALETELRWFFVPVFLILGAAGGLGSALLRPESTVPTIGASGAISGMIGAYLVLFPEASIRLLVFVWAIPSLLLRIGSPVLDIPAWIFIALWIAFQLSGGLGAQFSPSGVDYGAHLAGFIAGYGLVRLLRASLGLWPDQHEPRPIGWEPLRQPPRGRRGTYLVADRPLKAGHVLQPGDLVVAKPPSGLADPNSVAPRERAAVLGRRLRVDRFRYEPLLWSDLVEPERAEAARLDAPRVRP